MTKKAAELIDAILSGAASRKQGNAESSAQVFYRDGKPVTDRPQAEIAKIVFEHRNPQHPNFNRDDFGGATAEAGTEPAKFFHEWTTRETAAQSRAGKDRARELKKAADESAQPIYEKWKELKNKGTPKRKLYSKTAEWCQRSTGHNDCDIRQVRRAVDRLRKKDKS